MAAPSRASNPQSVLFACAMNSVRSPMAEAMTKAVVFGQDALSGNKPGYKVDPALVANLYRAMIIPLTKQVQVTYLLRRLGHADKVPQSPEDWPPYLRAFALGDTEEQQVLGY